MTELISCRAEDGTAKRAEALAKKMSAHPTFTGLKLSRSRVLTMALARGLEALEQEYGKKGGRK